MDTSDERPPFVTASITSFQAAQAARGRVVNQRERLYYWLAARPYGGTSDEWYEAHGDRHTALGTRLVELERLGCVRRWGSRLGRMGTPCDVFWALPVEIGPETFRHPPVPPSARSIMQAAREALFWGDTEGALAILDSALN